MSHPYKGLVKGYPRKDVIQLWKGQAVAILQLKAVDEEFAGNWVVMAKGYDNDWENYTEIMPDEIDNVKNGDYADYQLWKVR